MLIAGVDEAGRGPLCGAVVAAAVILDPYRPVAGLRDSKKLSTGRREALREAIESMALDWALGRAEPEEIDRLNILQATLLAMKRALTALSARPGLVIVDGNRCPDWTECPVQALVGGDDRIEAVSAASILAKTTRDREMLRLDAEYPGYGLARHKGYPTREHREALEKLGPSPIHRCSFAPVARAARIANKSR
ncbi:MAG: ribonuclease HII [Kistimonas sp.]|nr:ribonuclease HII [Kistimonas sp.]